MATMISLVKFLSKSIKNSQASLTFIRLCYMLKLNHDERLAKGVSPAVMPLFNFLPQLPTAFCLVLFKFLSCPFYKVIFYEIVYLFSPLIYYPIDTKIQILFKGSHLKHSTLFFISVDY